MLDLNEESKRTKVKSKNFGSIKYQDPKAVNQKPSTDQLDLGSLSKEFTKEQTNCVLTASNLLKQSIKFYY